MLSIATMTDKPDLNQVGQVPVNMTTLLLKDYEWYFAFYLDKTGVDLNIKIIYYCEHL